MEAAVPVISAIFMGVTNLIRSVNDNDNQNRNFYDSEEYRNMQINQENEIKKIKEESEQKIKAMMDESLQREKLIEKEYEIKIAGYQKEMDYIKNINLEREKELKEQIVKNEKERKKMKKKKEEYENEKKQLEKQNLELQQQINTNYEINKRQESELIGLKNKNNDLERDLMEKEKNFKKTLNDQEIEYKNSLKKLELQNSEIEEMNRKKKLENEKSIKNNEKELNSIKNKTKEIMELENEKFNKLEKEEKEKEEKKKMEEERIKQKEEENKILALKEFNEKAEKKIKEFIEKLKKIISGKKFFEELLKKYDTNEISGVVNKIIGKVDLNDVFSKKTKNFLNLVETIEINPEMNHLNLLLLGPTGSGKSTLINTLLELEGQEKAEVGDDNNPKTMAFHSYTSNKKKNIRCFDSRGIEKSKEYSLDKFIKNSKELILGKLKKNNPDEFIHIILYCFGGDRFINEVRDSLYKLMDLYNDDTLPIILVHTRGVEGEDDELFEVIKKTLNKENRKIDMINICAEKDDEFPAFGIPELFTLIVSKVKKSVKSACFSSVKNKVRDNFLKVNMEYKNEFKKEFEIIIEKEMKDIKLDSNLKEQKEKYLKIFSNIFEKILFENKKKIDQNCEHLLENYLNNFFNWTFHESNDYMIDFISKNSFELISDLLTIQHNINWTYDNKLSVQKNTEEWKKEIDQALKEKLENYILFSLMKEGSIFIYEKYNEILLNELEQLYKEYLKNENQIINDVTKGKVEEIINNLIFN